MGSFGMGYNWHKIYNDLDEIVNETYFGITLNTEYYPDSYDCIFCGESIPVDVLAAPEIQNETAENLIHGNTCKLVKLRSLVNTLGDMIA